MLEHAALWLEIIDDLRAVEGTGTDLVAFCVILESRACDALVVNEDAPGTAASRRCTPRNGCASGA
jgi:hypothetical protein